MVIDGNVVQFFIKFFLYMVIDNVILCVYFGFNSYYWVGLKIVVFILVIILDIQVDLKVF